MAPPSDPTTPSSDPTDPSFPVVREDVGESSVPPNLLGPASKSSEMEEAVEKAGFPHEASHPNDHGETDDAGGVHGLPLDELEA